MKMGFRIDDHSGDLVRVQRRAPTIDEWARAARLINKLASAIGYVVPGSYSGLFSDLNTHFLSDAQIRPTAERELDPK